MKGFRVLLPVVFGLSLAACQPAASPTPEPTHVEGLGSIHFPNSGAAAAQDDFLRGVLLLHSFEFEPAADAFRRAQEADPDFALSYWGEAMTYNHPLWQEQDRAAALETLSRLGSDPTARREKAGTEREAMYLDAIESLYGEGTKGARDTAYMASMERLAGAYPDDREAAAFHALSILGSRNGVRDFATYMRAAAVAQPVFDDNPDHPGAAHYLIHSFDDPIHAPLGLPAADAYSEIAPEAAHAQHMTTHIFVAMGDWERVIRNNIRARDTQDAARAAEGLGPNACGHYSSWLHYGYLQLGQVSEAEALMDLCAEAAAAIPRGEAGGGTLSYYVAMRARHVVDTEDWTLADRWNVDVAAAPGTIAVADDLTTAIAALKAGDAGPARALVAGRGDYPPSLALQFTELRGLLSLHDGQTERGIQLLRDAADAEDALPFEFGPPGMVQPTHEALGEALLALGRPDEAASAFRRAVERTPGRASAVRGLESSTRAGPR